jgi:hypothetical protein
MAIETLKHRQMIGNFHVFHGSPCRHDSPSDTYIMIDHSQNSIHFKIQNGPIKEHGLNGCQVDTIIETGKLILEGLDDIFPSEWNLKAIQNLNAALDCLKMRTRSRMQRGVEGTNQA